MYCKDQEFFKENNMEIRECHSTCIEFDFDTKKFKVCENFMKGNYKPKMNKKHCVGCEDNFYNGNNDIGVQECWGFETAKLVLKKQVSIHQVPPWKQEPTQVPSCYHKRGYVFIDKDREC